MFGSAVTRFLLATTVAFTNSSVSEVPVRFAPEYGCVANLPAPHPSGGMIKAHMRISCKRPVAEGRVQVQLWRLRSWGWEQIGDPGTYRKRNGVRTVDASATANASKAECYYYRSTGKGYIINWRGEEQDTPGEGVSYDQRYLKGLPPGCGTKW